MARYEVSAWFTIEADSPEEAHTVAETVADSITSSGGVQLGVEDTVLDVTDEWGADDAVVG